MRGAINAVGLAEQHGGASAKQVIDYLLFTIYYLPFIIYILPFRLCGAIQWVRIL